MFLNMDFTLDKYRELCQTVIRENFETITFRDFFMSNLKNHKFIIFRHDVERDIYKALHMARLENEYGIAATYYIRYNSKVFLQNIIEEISRLGHEIGYHYEVLDKANGDYDEAVEIFKRELKGFREITTIDTVCMHGGNIFTRWSNKDLWGKIDLTEFNILGEPYISVDYTKIDYFTDTSRTWENKYQLKDNVEFNRHSIKTTDDLISLIDEGKIKKACILAHPDRWNNNVISWSKELIFQNIKNIGKAGILFYKKFSTKGGA